MENFVCGQKGSDDAGARHEAFVFTRLYLYAGVENGNATEVCVAQQRCAKGCNCLSLPAISFGVRDT